MTLIFCCPPRKTHGRRIKPTNATVFNKSHMKQTYKINCYMAANLYINVRPKPGTMFLLQMVSFQTRVFICRESTCKISCHVASNLCINVEFKPGPMFLLQTVSFHTCVFGCLCVSFVHFFHLSTKLIFICCKNPFFLATN